MKKAGKSYLVIDREEFCKKLQLRVVSGQELLARQITSEETLEKFKAEISEWSDYNLELLKQSFNNPENEYRQEYKKSYIHLGFIGTHSLEDNIKTQKKKIASYLKAIENLMSKAELIPTLQNDHKRN
ncbi:MAG: hypothetical protein LBG80_11660 [Bacteroidales bacterium]|jgi:hypothetical protein|nr:hypothetical protein [Bacteroidales bacterium]